MHLFFSFVYAGTRRHAVKRSRVRTCEGILKEAPERIKQAIRRDGHQKREKRQTDKSRQPTVGLQLTRSHTASPPISRTTRITWPAHCVINTSRIGTAFALIAAVAMLFQGSRVWGKLVGRLGGGEKVEGIKSPDGPERGRAVRCDDFGLGAGHC